jgi:hypothetical protein
MQVFYAAGQPNPRLPVVYRPGQVKFCCPKMERHWGALVAFGMPGRDTTSRTVNLCVPVPQANGKEVLEVASVDFCPWCGQLIEVCRKK